MKKLLFLLGLASATTACLNENTNNNSFSAQGIATAKVQKIGSTNDSMFFFVCDDNTSLFPENFNDFRNYPLNNTRYYISYVVWPKKEQPGYDYVIELANGNIVPIVNVQKSSTLSIGQAHNDAVQYITTWPGKQYLNVSYSYLYDTAPNKHTINLWLDSTVSTSPTTLYFKHNANGDRQRAMASAIVSFDLESLRSITTADSINLKFVTDLSSGPYSYAFTYKFKK